MQTAAEKNFPLVSVIICCYNHAHFLPEAINTILYQSYPHIEIVVINDGSTDNTEDVVQQYENIVYVYKQNGGLAAARNTGIEKSSGEFILYLDADDFLLPEAISINANYLIHHPSLAFVSGGHVSMDGKGNVVSIQTNTVEANHFEQLLQYNYIGMHATVMYRRWALQAYLFDPVLRRGCDDYDSYLGIAAKYPVLHHTQLLTGYRRHDNNISSNYREMLVTTTSILQKHAQQLTDTYLLEKAKIGFENWKNYSVSKEWSKFQKIPFWLVQQKLKSGIFLYQQKPSLLKSYFIGNYRKTKIKNWVSHFLPNTIFKKASSNISTTSKLQVSEKICTVLMYHRIANTNSDAWNICVSKENFEQQLQFIKQHQLAISFAEFQEYLQGKPLPSNKFFLTFDDGYEDNFTTVKPLLEQYNIPALFFLTTQKTTDNSFVYYWDVLEKLFLTAPNLPSQIVLTVNKGTIQIDIAAAEQKTTTPETLQWRAFTQKPFNTRTYACYKLWVYLQNLPYTQLQNVVHQLIVQCNTTIEQLQIPMVANATTIETIKNHPLIAVGVHTATHPILPTLTATKQTQEIVASKNKLEAILQSSIHSFAYPDGKYNADTLDCLKEQGFTIAFTTQQQSNTLVNQNKLLLNRVLVNNVSAAQLKQQLHIN